MTDASPQQSTLLESVQWLTRWLDRDDDLAGGPAPHWAPLDGLLSGGDGQPYRSESELAALRQEGRWFAAGHPFAISAIENRISYVVGTGHNYTLRPKPGAEIDPETLSIVNAELLDFTNRNRWQARQVECQRRLDRDGEVFLRLFVVEGRLVVRFIEPEQVSQPLGAAAATAAYGIETEPDDVESVRAYHVRRDPQRPAWQRVPAEEVQHRKANVDCTTPRGVPLTYSVRANLRRAWKLLRNMSTVASVQAAIAIVRKHTGSSGGSVQQYVNQAATAVQSNPAGGGPKTFQQYPAGAIVDTPPGVEYQFPAQAIDVARFVSALQAELRAVAARLAMPEFMLSADASNANYSSTMVAEGPAVKMFERLQSEAIWHDVAILRRALETAEGAGRLPAGVSALVQIDAEAPIVQSRNRLAEAQADQILLTLGVVSPQSVAARHGYDYQAERDLMDQAAERETGLPAGNAGNDEGRSPSDEGIANDQVPMTND